MFAWLRERWRLAKEIHRLSEESWRLKQELELQTGEPVKLTEEERAELSRLAEGVNKKTLERLSVFGSEIDASSEIGEPTNKVRGD